MNAEHAITQILGMLDGGRVLDVATGPGVMIAWLADLLGSYESFTGIDVVDPPADEASGPSVFAGEHVQFIHMDAHAMAFEDASFDTTCIGNALHHTANPAQVLGEMRRVLAPGGYLIVREMVSDGQTESQLTHILMHNWWAEIDGALGVSHRPTYTRAEVVAQVAALGLETITLFDYADLDGDPHDAERTALYHTRMTRYLERARNLPDYPALAERAAALSERLDRVGALHPTALVAVARR